VALSVRFSMLYFGALKLARRVFKPSIHPQYVSSRSGQSLKTALKAAFKAAFSNYSYLSKYR